MEAPLLRPARPVRALFQTLDGLIEDKSGEVDGFPYAAGSLPRDVEHNWLLWPLGITIRWAIGEELRDERQKLRRSMRDVTGAGNGDASSQTSHSDCEFGCSTYTAAAATTLAVQPIAKPRRKWVTILSRH